MSSAGDDSDLDAPGLFAEPDGYYAPEKTPTTAVHVLLSGHPLTLRLVGHNPLWGHLLWNAGRTIATYLEERAAGLVQDKTVLELGAGSGLPSLVCAIRGAARVVVTDYPDADLIDNLRYNISQCSLLPEHGSTIAAEGYLWGAPVDPLLAHLPDASIHAGAVAPIAEQPGVEKADKSVPPVPVSSTTPGFDVLILADLLFNHSEHAKLVQSVEKTLRRTPDARALVFFTPYRPWLLEKDLAFFDLARNSGFTVEKVLEKVMDKVMFEEDPGDELLRRTVYGYELRWAGLQSGGES